MSCSPQLIEILSGVAAIHAEFPRGRGRGFAARMQAKAERLSPRLNASTIILAEAIAIAIVCDECGIELADVVANEALREDVIDAAMPKYFALCAEDGE